MLKGLRTLGRWDTRTHGRCDARTLGRSDPIVGTSADSAIGLGPLRSMPPYHHSGIPPHPVFSEIELLVLELVMICKVAK